jgi:hypothetical protein
MNHTHLTLEEQERAAYMAGHYPCPSVTSEHDKSVIFDAIRKGEGMSDE